MLIPAIAPSSARGCPLSYYMLLVYSLLQLVLLVLLLVVPLHLLSDQGGVVAFEVYWAC